MKAAGQGVLFLFMKTNRNQKWAALAFVPLLASAECAYAQDTSANNTKTPDDRGFFGVGGGKEGAGKIVYVVDRSGSMVDSIEFVRAELKRSIGTLTDEQEFHVIFYSSGPPVEMPTGRLVKATERNKQLAGQFIDGIVPQGETDPSKALERAFACQP